MGTLLQHLYNWKILYIQFDRSIYRFSFWLNAFVSIIIFDLIIS
jgi:hypothetical protein